jgi:hypothetical protein
LHGESGHKARNPQSGFYLLKRKNRNNLVIEQRFFFESLGRLTQPLLKPFRVVLPVTGQRNLVAVAQKRPVIRSQKFSKAANVSMSMKTEELRAWVDLLARETRGFKRRV